MNKVMNCYFEKKVRNAGFINKGKGICTPSGGTTGGPTGTLRYFR